MRARFRHVLLGAVWGMLMTSAPVGAQAIRLPSLPVPRKFLPTPAVPATVLGINTGTPLYYSGEHVFRDIVRNHADVTFGGQLTLPLAVERGRPVSVPAGTIFYVPLDFSLGWQTGTYTCTISPGWSVASRFPGIGGTVAGSGTSFTLTVPQRTNAYSVQLELMATADGARLDTLSCLPPSTLPPALQSPLTQGFTDDMRPFRVIRFMDYMGPNAAPPTTWATRPLPTDLSLASNGMSVEDMVDIANRLGSDPWFTLPLDADDDYVRRFATYVRDHLAVTRKAYVELSNEVWNPSFPQSAAATARGRAAYPGATDQQANDYYYGDRVRGFMGIWSAVFAGQTGRIVRVAATQLVWTQRGEDLLGHNDTYKSVDALAGAPYFGSFVQGLPGSGAARVDAYFAALPQQIDAIVTAGVAMKAVADKYGVRFITYEAGPDLVGYTPDASADAQTILYDPRLHDQYLVFLNQWKTKVGDLLMPYNSVGAGTYSHKDYTGQPTAQTQKMRALVDFAATLPPAL